MFDIGATVSRKDGSQFQVTEVGERCDMAGGYIAPVRLSDGTYGIANVYDNNGPYPFGIWEPDVVDAASALAHSREMPTVHRGIGSDVVHVHGRDATGTYLVKMYHNEKKHHYQRADELYR